jgi:hypothetical protein
MGRSSTNKKRREQNNRERKGGRRKLKIEFLLSFKSKPEIELSIHVTPSRKKGRHDNINSHNVTMHSNDEVTRAMNTLADATGGVEKKFVVRINNQQDGFMTKNEFTVLELGMLRDYHDSSENGVTKISVCVEINNILSSQRIFSNSTMHRQGMTNLVQFIAGHRQGATKHKSTSLLF